MDDLMFSPDENINVSDGSKALLAKIAEALDCSPDAFLEPGSCELRQAAELMALWHLLRNSQDRAKVLAYLRGIIPGV